MTTSRDPALVLDDASASFGATTALAGITGTVPRGGSVALIGPNGAGKTTLIRAIIGAVPLARGRIDVLGTTPKRARGRVAYVPQADTLDAQFPIDALGVVLMGRYRRIGCLRRPGTGDRAAARDALDRVGLADRAGVRFGGLSGGQRQRVLLARAIAQEAELLLLDEPFNGVDSRTTDLVVDVLAQLRATGVAVVMSTHDLAVAHLTCDDACLLNTHQVAFGPIRDTLTPARLQSAYGHGAVVLADGATFVSTR
ncbi:MAG: manganese/iron transport system ATP-binding protein [Actinomycetota bacterium]